MPYERPGERYYPAAATKAVVHGTLTVEDQVVGIALKQQAAAFGTGLGSALITTIAVGEDFVIDCEGIIEVPNTGITTAIKGTMIYITEANNALSLASGTGKVRVGRVFEVPGERETGATTLRVKLAGAGVGISGAA